MKGRARSKAEPKAGGFEPDARGTAAESGPAAAAPPRRPAQVRRAAEQVRALIVQLMGRRPRRIVHRASGLSNLVFEVAHPDGEFIVRLSPTASKLNTFLKEQWAMLRAREAGVPVPEVLEVGGELAEQPYMILRKVDGIEASSLAQRTELARQMGRCAAQIHTIATRGFGRSFDWSANTLSRCASWAQFLEEEMRLAERLALFERHRLLNAAQCRQLQRTLEGIGRTRGRLRTALAHGDMRAKNIVVDARGEIAAVLDWEDCCSQPAPIWELAIALHDLTIDDKHAFLDGYGLTARAVRELAPALKALNVVNYSEQIALLVRQKDRAGLEQYRLRLSGALDLYSL